MARLGLLQPLQDAGVDVDDLGDAFELPAGHLEGGRVFEDGVGMMLMIIAVVNLNGSLRH